MLCQKLGYYNKLCDQPSPNDPTMTVFTDLAPILHTHLDISHSTNSQLIDWIVLSHKEQADLSHRRPHYRRPHLLTADTQTGGRGQQARCAPAAQGEAGQESCCQEGCPCQEGCRCCACRGCCACGTDSAGTPGCLALPYRRQALKHWPLRPSPMEKARNRELFAGF